jgi:hypothetical protein
MMDNGQKLTNSESYTPSSEPFRFYSLLDLKAGGLQSMSLHLQTEQVDFWSILDAAKEEIDTKQATNTT